MAQCFAYAFGSVCLLSSSVVHAQRVPIDAGALQRNLENQLPLLSPLELTEPKSHLNEVHTPKADVATVIVSRFELVGVKLIPEAEVQEVLQPFLGRQITFDDLQAACDAIEKRYRMRGYLVQAIVPPQTVKDGVITIMITEATLGAVVIDTPQGGSRFGAERAAKYITWANPPGRELDLQAISRAIVILNEIPGVAVSSAMESGANDGETNLRLVLQDTPRYSATVEGNNFGSRSTGAAQGVFQAALNNPLGYGDQLAVNGIYSQGSSYTQAAYNFPLLPNGLRGGVSGTYLNYKNVPAYQSNGGYGEAETLGVSLAYPMVRSEGGNANVTLRYDTKSYLNYLIATDAVSSSYRINDISLGISGNHNDNLFGGGVNSGQINFVIGRLNLQSNSPANYGVYTPDSYVKLTYSGNRVQTLIPNVSNLLISLSGQFANQNLNSAEQFYLGGPYGVRAYPVAQGAGAQGAQATIEYQHSLSNDVLGIAFVDAGVVQQYISTYPNWQGNTNADNVYHLYGAGFGFKWNVEGVSVAATVAWKLRANPLYNQQGQQVNVDNSTTNPRAWLTASYGF